MSARDRFINYVKFGGEKPFVSLQIGAGAGFDVKLAGKSWNSEGTFADTIAAYEMVGCEPLFNIGLPGLGELAPELDKQVKRDDRPDDRIWEERLDTPYGPLEWKFHEKPKTGTMILRYPVDISDDEVAFDKVAWFCEEHLNRADRVSDLLRDSIAQLQAHGPVSVQWNLQPFELFGLTSVDNLVLLAKMYPERYRRTCDFIRDANLEILKHVAAAGADFVFLGGPGAEMLSPDLYAEYLIPDSQAISAAVHQHGKLIYSHICSPIEPFLTMGLYNDMGIDLFETLSPPPVGNVPDLAQARQCLPAEMCTRGNIGLDVLLNGSVDDVVQATLNVLEATKGRKHMVAASDYLFYDIPLANAQAVVETAKNWRG